MTPPPSSSTISQSQSASSQNPSTHPPKIRILTLNTWCIKYHSPQPIPRLTSLANHLLALPNPPHILCVQELFVHSLFTHLAKLLAPILPHARFFNGGPFGSGLAILSAWPILGGRMEEYSLGGRPSAFWRGDWYVGKGVAMVRVRMPREFCDGDQGEGEGGELQVFNTHLHAPYNEGTEGKDTYLAHRVSEAWQIGRLVGDAMERNQLEGRKEGLVVAAGDFNMVPGSIEYRTFLERANNSSSPSTATITRPLLHDSWRVLHPESSIGAFSAFDGLEAQRLSSSSSSSKVESALSPPTIHQSRTQHGHTCDSRSNTWRWDERERKAFQRRGIVPSDANDDGTPDDKSKRLDYVFFGDGRRQDAQGGGVQGWTVHSAKVCFSTPEYRVLRIGNLSDHFGVLVELTRHKPTSSSALHSQQQRASQPSAPFLSPTTPLSNLLLPIINTYALRCRLHRRRRMSHFVLGVFVTIGCWVAVGVVPYGWAAVPLTVLASLGLVAGCVDGLLGGLWGGLEVRRLEEFRREVRDWGVERGVDVGEKVKGQRDEGVRDWYA